MARFLDCESLLTLGVGGAGQSVGAVEARVLGDLRGPPPPSVAPLCAYLAWAVAPGEGRASPAATWTQVLSKAEGGPGGASSRWGQLSGARSGKRPQPVAEGPGQLRKAESVLQYHLPWASGTGVQSCLCLLQVHPVPTLSPAAPFHPSHILMGGPLRVWVLLLCTSDLPLLPASHLAWRSQSLAWPPSPVTADLRGCPSPAHA